MLPNCTPMPLMTILSFGKSCPLKLPKFQFYSNLGSYFTNICVTIFMLNHFYLSNYLTLGCYPFIA